MRPDDILSAMGQIDDDMITGSEKKPGGGKPPIRYFIIVAAAVAALTAVALAVGLNVSRPGVPSRVDTVPTGRDPSSKYDDTTEPTETESDPAFFETDPPQDSDTDPVDVSTEPEESGTVPEETDKDVRLPVVGPDTADPSPTPESADPAPIPGTDKTTDTERNTDPDPVTTAETEESSEPPSGGETETEPVDPGPVDPPVVDPTDDTKDVFTRAMAVSVLYEMSGEPEVTGTSTFSDVPEEAWYSDPVTWAQSEGVVNGRTPTRFDPEEEANRAEFAAMMSRYITASDTVVYEERGGEPSDIASVPEYAKEPVTKMYRSGIINGRENGAFDAADGITRSEARAIVERYEKKSIPKVTENGILEDNTVTLGWMLNALYELEGTPEVADWSPYDAFEGAEDVPEWAAEQAEKEFWEVAVREKWYYKTLMWARENYLYSVWRDNSEYVEIDFGEAYIYTEELVNLVYGYCERFGVKLPKTRDYPGFDDLDGTEYDLRGAIALYEAGILSGCDEKTFGIRDIVRYEDAVAVVRRLAELRQ